MIKGIGCDLCSIKRIEKATVRPEFVDKVFTVAEQKYCVGRGVQKCASFAARFAAKEAVMKAFGTGWRDGAWTDVEVIQNELGQPIILLHGYFKKLAGEQGISNVHLSLTHEKEFAAAYVVMEG